MENIELLFIPSPLMGHMGQAVELANLIINRFHHLSISLLVMKHPLDPVGTTYTQSLSSPSSSSNNNNDLDRIRFLHLPPPNPTSDWTSKTPGVLNDLVIDDAKPHVRDVVLRLTRPPAESPPSRRGRLAAFVVDMFCTPMIDVGKEFGVPTYVFFTSNAAFLGIMLHFQTLHDELGVNVPELKHSATELVTPSYANPVPPTVLPLVVVDERSWHTRFLLYARKYREAKGIIVNTFPELESHALRSYDSQTPPVYPVGPMLKHEQTKPNSDIMKWLDGQPQSSVVFLCFGSRGCFGVDQVREIATALEGSRFGFLWSLRRPPATNGFPGEYADFGEVLPDGFLERTAGRGKVIGWAPQMAVLSHVAVGGFVSHCGWNSVLESLWCGVPIATWPLYAEQQLDAFQLVEELGLGVEISLDYDQQNSSQAMVTAEVIEKGIRGVMDGDGEVRRRVKEMREKSRVALEEKGSSNTCLQSLIDDLMKVHLIGKNGSI